MQHHLLQALNFKPRLANKIYIFFIEISNAKLISVIS
jgi:hypothetical protein